MRKSTKSTGFAIGDMRGIIACAVTAALFLIPMFNMLVTGVFQWHIQQPEFWQGGMVMIGFVMGAFFLAYFFPNKKWHIVLFCGLLYLSSHGVVVPLVAAYVYFECLCYIGSTVLSFRSKEEQMPGDIVKNFIAGACIWGAAAIICSILEVATFNHLRILTVILFLGSLMLSREKKYSIAIGKRFHSFLDEVWEKKSVFFILLFVFFCFLALVAKTRTALEYDSLWYGLRPEYVLVGPNSFYDNLGLSSFVYYYPKLMELLFLPISNLGDYSFIMTGNILVFGLLLISIWGACRNLLGISRDRTVYFLAIIATIPAIAGISTTAKPDILGAFFVFAAWAFLFEFSQSKKLEPLIWGIVGLILCTGTKQTYLLWGGLLFVCMFIPIVQNRAELSAQLKKRTLYPLSPVLWVLGCGIFFVLGVHLRTYFLTGFPLYPVGVDFFSKIGFTANYPFISSFHVYTVPPVDVGSFFLRLYHFILNPGPLGKVIMLWTSNVTLCCFITWLIYYKRGAGQKNLFRIVLNILFLVGTLYYVQCMESPDGNYFILPMLVLAMHLLGDMQRRWESVGSAPSSRTASLICLIIIAVQFPIMFVSHPSWDRGTRPFSTQVIAQDLSNKEIKHRTFEYRQLLNIDAYINDNMRDARLITTMGDMKIIGHFNCTIQNSTDIDAYCASPIITSNLESFAQYLDYADIQAIIVDHETNSHVKNLCLSYLDQYGYRDKIEDGGADLYVLY